MRHGEGTPQSVDVCTRRKCDNNKDRDPGADTTSPLPKKKMSYAAVHCVASSHSSYRRLRNRR